MCTRPWPNCWKTWAKVPSWEPKHALKCPLRWQKCTLKFPLFSPLPFKKSVHATAQTSCRHLIHMSLYEMFCFIHSSRHNVTSHCLLLYSVLWIGSWIRTFVLLFTDMPSPCDRRIHRMNARTSRSRQINELLHQNSPDLGLTYVLFLNVRTRSESWCRGKICCSHSSFLCLIRNKSPSVLKIT